MNEEEKKKEEKNNYRVLPSYENGTLEEWEAFNPYSMMSAYIKQHFIYKLSSAKRNSNRTQRKG
jgi:hypothetical protein